MSSNRRTVVVAAATASAVAVGLASATPAGADRGSSLRGVFAETTSGSAAGYDIHGSAKLTIGQLGTVVTVTVAGLDPDKLYGSHLHNATCASGGGGHYQDIEGGATVPPNELWLSSTNASGLVSNPGGVAHGTSSATWIARLSSASTNARSVIVHEPGSGTRIACADLR